MVGKYNVITLCGSTRFKDAFLETQKRLTLEGNIVISVGLFGHSGDDEVWTPGTKEMLDDMHKRKIDMADEIYVINVDGYIGDSTRTEIEYAISSGKKVQYLINPSTERKICMAPGNNEKLNMDEELDKIALTLKYMDDVKTWEAFIADPVFDELFDDETFLAFAKDAADAANRVKYDTDYLTIFNSAVNEYRGLLIKYHYPEDKMEQSIHNMTCDFLMGRVEVFRQISINEGGSEEIPEMPDDDIDNYTMAMIFANLPPQPEIAAYLKEINVTYDYDHLHMVTWFSAQMHHGKGNYSRTEHNYSAKTTYNRLLNPYSLMWIAAALEEDPEVVKKAAAEVEKVKSFASKCGAVRKEIPFSRILELANIMFDRLCPETEEEE